jgi:heme a synthase
MNYRLPLVTTIVIGLQMVLGEVIVGRDAGFVCPDWPLCQGGVMPSLTLNLSLELIHRGSALFVSLLVLYTMVVVLLKHSQNRMMVRLSWLSILSLFAQIVIGGLIVIWKLPGAVTTIDVMNSMFLLSLYVMLTVYWRINERVGGTKPVTADGPLASLRKSAWWLVASLGFAILVGALFRHTGASQALFHQDSYIKTHGQTVPPSMTSSIMALALHMMSGLLLAFVVGWFVISTKKVKRLETPARAVFVLVILQIILGIVSLETQLSLLVVTLHWLNASILCALSTWIAIRAHIAEAPTLRADGYQAAKFWKPRSARP